MKIVRWGISSWYITYLAFLSIYLVRKGDIVNVTTEIDAGWWEGELADGSGHQGMFPSNYVEEIKSSGAAIPSRHEDTQSPLNNSGRFSAGVSRISTNDVMNNSGGGVGGFGLNNNGSRSLNNSGNGARMFADRGIEEEPSQFAANRLSNIGGSTQSTSNSNSNNRISAAYSGGGGGSRTSYGGVGGAGYGGGAAAAASAAASCSVCICTDFKPNAFKAGQCSNCFHKH